MTDRQTSLMQAVQRYLDLCQDNDRSRFDRVFRPTAQLHGIVDGALKKSTAAEFRDGFLSRPSPISQGSQRADEILLVDFASDTQAMTKLRLRINNTVYVDYLTWHRLDGEWLITAKGFHIETTRAA
jgi:hypothetical protein